MKIILQLSSNTHLICSTVLHKRLYALMLMVNLDQAVRTEWVNPYLPSGLFHPYQLDSPFSKSGVSGVLLHFYSTSNRNLCKQTV